MIFSREFFPLTSGQPVGPPLWCHLGVEGFKFNPERCSTANLAELLLPGYADRSPFLGNNNAQGIASFRQAQGCRVAETQGAKRPALMESGRWQPN